MRAAVVLAAIVVLVAAVECSMRQVCYFVEDSADGGRHVDPLEPTEPQK